MNQSLSLHDKTFQHPSPRMEWMQLESVDVDVIKNQINSMFTDTFNTLIELKVIKNPNHINQLKTDYDWWSYLIKVMRNYPYKGQDLYDAAATLASDLWQNVFNPKKYVDQNPPLAVFHKMSMLRGQDIAFRFFGWRRKLKTTNLSVDPITKTDVSSNMEWKELQHQINSIIRQDPNEVRALRAVDVLNVKLSGFSNIYNKSITQTGLDSLANFYLISRREMYDTLLLIYKSIRSMAKDISDDFLTKVLDSLPESLKKDPQETVLGLMPSSGEISHSELFAKAYSINRELKSLSFKEIIQQLLKNNLIKVRRDTRVGKHQILYNLV